MQDVTSIKDRRDFVVRWRDQFIRLDQWADDQFGRFTYLTQNGFFEVAYELRPSGDAAGGVAIILHALNGEAPSGDLPATAMIDGVLHLAPAASLAPTTVPAAILMTLVWAEWFAADADAAP